MEIWLEAFDWSVEVSSLSLFWNGTELAIWFLFECNMFKAVVIVTLKSEVLMWIFAIHCFCV